jgi:hypothetical protein
MSIKSFNPSFKVNYQQMMYIYISGGNLTFFWGISGVLGFLKGVLYQNLDILGDFFSV